MSISYIVSDFGSTHSPQSLRIAPNAHLQLCLTLTNTWDPCVISNLAFLHRTTMSGPHVKLLLLLLSLSLCSMPLVHSRSELKWSARSLTQSTPWDRAPTCSSSIHPRWWPGCASAVTGALVVDLEQRGMGAVAEGRSAGTVNRGR